MKEFRGPAIKDIGGHLMPIVSIREYDMNRRGAMSYRSQSQKHEIERVPFYCEQPFGWSWERYAMWLKGAVNRLVKPSKVRAEKTY